MKRLLLAAALWSGCMAPVQTGAPRRASVPAFPASGIVSYFRLDGDGRDAAGPNDAAGANPRAVADRYGRPGRALRFDGDRLVVPAPQGLDIDARTESYTVALWVRSDGTGASRILEKWSEDASPYPFSIQAGPAGLHGAIFDGRTAWIARVTDLWDGDWHHVAITFDAPTGTLAAYRDGALAEAQTARLGASTRNRAPLSIGGAPVADRFFRGDLDDVLLYRRALRPDEVAALAFR